MKTLHLNVPLLLGALTLCGIVISSTQSSAVHAAVQPQSELNSGVQHLTSLEKELSKLPENVYERLEAIESIQKRLKTLEKAPEINTGHWQALQGLSLYHLANTRNEMGASAVDYWAYVIDVVEPLQHQAKLAFDEALKQTNTPQTIKAWSYFYRGELQFEYAEDAARQDFAKACELGYTQACTLK